MKRIEWRNKARRQLQKIKDAKVRGDIFSAVTALVDWPEVGGVKNLVNRQGHRLRVGDFRVFFFLDGDTIMITEVRRRNERTY